MEADLILENKLDVTKKKSDIENVLFNYQREIYPVKETFMAWLLENGGPEAVELFQVIVACEYFSTWTWKIKEQGYRLNEDGYKTLTHEKRRLARAVKRFKLKFPMDFNNG